MGVENMWRITDTSLVKGVVNVLMSRSFLVLFLRFLGTLRSLAVKGSAFWSNCPYSCCKYFCDFLKGAEESTGLKLPEVKLLAA